MFSTFLAQLKRLRKLKKPDEIIRRQTELLNKLSSEQKFALFDFIYKKIDKK